ncbi:MFS transporter [Rhodococcus sp. WB9]|uniref:MFS transporter n=1 Tax=Rhodococcus sp. WB9 TaxID=2594007 RepID=UPI00118508C8|nr:MFS transporter [Rhodococcus sp. WB9]QDQ89511.1 MFS transporter [Rhodococcus sp. WB9]
MTSEIAPPGPPAPLTDTRPPRLHYAWLVAAVAFLALVGAASFRAAPSILIDPLHEDFGWSRASISAAVSINLVLYGLTSPFAAALMERFGMRRVVTAALVLVSAGSGLTVFMTATWQLVLLWGVLVGLGTGSMALAFVATVVDRWFVTRRGLVTGILTAGSAAGQLVFLPILAMVAEHYNWQTVALTVSFAALAVVPLVLAFLRNRPSDVGTVPYGAGADYVAAPPAPTGRGGAAGRAVTVLVSAARTRVFWLLAGTFAICGASTNGLVGTHFVPAAHDHGMPVTAAASLLAVIGIFDVIGTIASGWFTDRFDSRKLLGIYYLLRGISLMLLPILFANTVHPPMIAFVIFYGLDWVATVPPTVALCRRHFGGDAPIVFGWVLASHQIGAGIVAFLAGLVRDQFGGYDSAFYVAGGLCAIAAVMSLAIAARPRKMAAEHG